MHVAEEGRPLVPVPLAGPLGLPLAICLLLSGSGMALVFVDSRRYSEALVSFHHSCWLPILAFDLVLGLQTK